MTTATAPPVARNEAFVDQDAPPIPVAFGACPCPGAPHADDKVRDAQGKILGKGDTIFLRPELDLQGGFTFTSSFATNAVDDAGMPLEQALGMAYLVAGITDWTFLDKEGKKIPASRSNVALLRWTPALAEVAEVAAKRYGVAALSL